MTISLSPTEFTANAVLRAFLLSVLPAGTPVIRGQTNRVPEPASPNFVVMTPIRRERLSTNVDQFVDTKFTASIAANSMAVTGLAYGSLKVGSLIFGVDLPTGSASPVVIRQVSGSAGGTGVYQVSGTGAVSSRIMAAGVLNAIAPTELTVQCDVHGPSGGDNSQIITTMLRDDYAYQFMTRDGRGVFPLTSLSRGQIPFINAEQAWEDRWIVEACLQINATVNDIPQEFFDQVIVGFKPVDIEYLP